MPAKKVISTNKKAYHDYFVEDTLEAGIELAGTEVKSLRQGSVNLRYCYFRIINGEIYVLGMHISSYEKGNIFNRDPMRDRRLLLHKKEILRLLGLVGQKGYAIIPLSLYLSGKWMKLELGLCKGKKLYDKRESLAKKDADREMERASSAKNY